MDKRLTARLQRLSRKLPQSTNKFSSTLVVEPDTAELLEKRGTLYVVFDVASGGAVDPLLVTKIVNDVLHDEYFSSESGSPIQSLERAIVKVREKVTKLPQTGISSDTGEIDFNILASVLWGNTLYMVQFGKGGSFLIREGSVKPVNSATEGSFSVASGVIRDGDVVILGTQEFLNSYKPEDLVSGAISFSTHELSELSSAMLIKFEETAAFTEAEKIDFGDRSEQASKVKEKMPKSSPSLSQLPKINITSVNKRKIKPAYIIGTLILFLLVGSIFFTLNKKDGSTGPSQTEEEKQVTENKQEGEKLNTTKDEELNIIRLEPEAFYDIKITDIEASPNDIVVLDNEVIVVDKNSGKMYSSGLVTPKFSEVEGVQVFGISHIAYFGGDLIFIDNTGYKVYSDGKIIEEYIQEGLGPVSAYLAFVYSLSGDTITKYEKTDGGLSGSLWSQDADLNGAVSIAIDGNIYVLKSDGSLFRYFTGEKEDFSITGLDRPLSNPTKVVKDVDLENIYIADKGNKRVVVLTEEGELVKQFVASGDVWNDIRSIGVTRDEETLFVLDGSKVYEVAL